MAASLQCLFARKATLTLLKRSGDLSLFSAWCSSNGRRAFPVTEVNAFHYGPHLKFTLASATALTSFRAAAGFAGHELGLDGALQAQANKRLEGLAFSMFIPKRLTQQRQALTAVQVRAMENFVVTGECLQDKVLTGFMLVCLYTRARFGDAMAIEKLDLDQDGNHGGNLQTSTSHSKTGTSKQKEVPVFATDSTSAWTTSRPMGTSIPGPAS